MKRIWAFLMAMFYIVSFTGCDKTEEPNEPVIDYDNLFDRTYSINDDGCRVLEGCEPTRATVIEDEVKGYGWKVIGIYEVQNDDRLSQKDHHETVCGGGYEDYWFESDSWLVGFHHSDIPGKFYNKTTWRYDATKGSVMCDTESESLQNRYMQVLASTTPQGKKFYMYTMQNIGAKYDEHGNQKPFYCTVAYQRMTDNELAKMKKTYDYNTNFDFTGAVPDGCKFRVSVRYYNPDDFEEGTNGSVIVTFGNAEFSLTDHLGTAVFPNPALEYFDSIVWRVNDRIVPGRYVIYHNNQDKAQTVLTWTTRFLYMNPNLTTYFEGCKKGRIVYTYTMHRDIYFDKFLCFDWGKFSISRPREFTATCLLDKSRSSAVYEPRTYNNDMNKVHAGLRYNSEEKGKGNGIAILEKEISELTEPMINRYGEGTEVGRQVEHYRTLFKALPGKAHITTYWATADTRVAPILNRDGTGSKNDCYYVHTGSVQQ